MQFQKPEPAVTSLVLYRGDPNVEAHLLGNGDLRLMSIRRAGVWVYSDIDTIGWWTWYTVARADLARLGGPGRGVLEAVRAAVAPGPEDKEKDDDERVAGIHRRFVSWLRAHGVPYTYDSYDEHEP